MNNSSIHRFLSRILVTCAGIATVSASGLSEPPLTIYGKVWDLNEGTSRQIFAGTLTLTLESASDPTETMTFTTELGQFSGNDQWSYLLEIPQNYLPSLSSEQKGLEVGTSGNDYLIRSLDLEGTEAYPLDSTRSLLTTSFSNKAAEHRFDLRMTLPVVDTDGDGIPDWWEELYGLNPLSASDASSNTDGDNWTALQEFLNGGTPDRDDRNIRLVLETIDLPTSGEAGLWFSVIDSDDIETPESIEFTVVEVGTPGGPGDELTLVRRNSVGDGSFTRQTLSPADTFTYDEVQQGRLLIEAGPSFSESSLVAIRLSGIGAIPSQVIVNEVNPTTHSVSQPVVWLEAGALGAGSGSVENWGGTISSPHAFQPNGGFQGLGNPGGQPEEGLLLFSEDFMYLNPGERSFENFTLLSSFSASLPGSEDGTIVHLGDFELALGGSNVGPRAQTLMLRRDGDTTFGSAVPLNTVVQSTATGNPDGATLRIEGNRAFQSQTDGTPFPSAFPTLGARQLYSSAASDQGVAALMKEVILFDYELSYSEMTRVEDYQLSRWSDFVVWDFRSAVLSLNLTGSPDSQNIMTGGWGSDHLAGNDLDDILRGGPGINLLEGGPGSDRFQFYFNEDTETIVDFDEGEFDIIDLSPIFSSKSGNPGSYLSFESKVNIVPGEVPTVDTLLKIDYDADGVDDQEILLAGVTYEDVDLPRLVGEGRIFLGGPGYDNQVALARSEEGLIETEVARQITLTRTGNVEAAMTVDLAFTGSAAIESDFSIANANGTGLVRSVTFGAGETEATIDLTPIQDALEEEEDINVSILPSNQLAATSEVGLIWSLDDAPEISITAIQPIAQRVGPSPAIFEIRREGPLDSPMELSLDFSGEALNGREYAVISPRVSLAAGVASTQLDLTPLLTSPIKDGPVDANLGIIADKTQFYLGENGIATATILDAYAGTLLTFADYVETYYPGQDADLMAGSDTDGDSVIAIVEYAKGTNPTVNDSSGPDLFRIYAENNRLEIHVDTVVGLSDVFLDLQASTNLINYVSGDESFDLELKLLPDNRVRRIYTSQLTLENLPEYQFYRVNVDRSR